MVYTIDEIKEKIQPIAKKYQLPQVYLFGSYARGEADEHSDVDVAVETRGSLATGLDFFALSDDLEEVLGQEVDVLSISGMSKDWTYVGQLVYQSYLKERKLLYEDGTVSEGLFAY
ncbi:nucleotidyltransferase family protein [Streptococcus merionis]|uniref:nucleotidyltransferase family protein n=1 Tax=Streptococcus merionis TaxID=400065 RepID=UPI003511D0E1